MPRPLSRALWLARFHLIIAISRLWIFSHKNRGAAHDSTMAPSSSSSSPIGLELGGPEHTIGKLIGQGAFGQVHAVNSKISNKTKAGSSSTTQQESWAVKLTPVPVKTTKKGTSAAEIAHRRLFSEYLLYTQHMRCLTGSILPRLPTPSSSSSRSLKEYYHDLNGYRCFVMERMDCLLMEALPRLVESSSSSAVQLGPVACKLIDIAEQVHKTKHILLDVKTDNIMIAKTTTSNKKSISKKITPQSFADSIRLVDLGLVTPFGGPHGHKKNVGTAELQGTPLYASLHNHELQTPSRRDDLESMLYIIGEIVLHCSNGKCYGRGPTASHLPWSQGGSDEEIGVVKRAHVLDKSSEYYRQMKNKAAADILYDTLQEVLSYKYGAVPNYDLIRDKLSQLQVKTNNKTTKKTSTAATTTKAAAKQKGSTSTTVKESTSTTRRSTQRTTRSPAASDDDEEEPTTLPVKTRKTRRPASGKYDDGDDEESPPVAKARKTDRCHDYSDVSMEDVQEIDDSSDDDEPEEMSIESEDDDDRKPAAKGEQDENHKPRKTTSGNDEAISLVIRGSGVESPIVVVLGNGGTESIVLGSNPTTSKSTERTLKLPDAALAASHVRLTLSKKHCGVQVQPISKQAKVSVNRTKCPVSGTVAFVNQNIIGLGDNDTTDVEITTANAETAKAASAKPTRRGRTKAAASESSNDKKNKTPTPLRKQEEEATRTGCTDQDGCWRGRGRRMGVGKRCVRNSCHWISPVVHFQKE